MDRWCKGLHCMHLKMSGDLLAMQSHLTAAVAFETRFVISPAFDLALHAC